MLGSAEKLLHELTAAGLLSTNEITKFDREIAVGVEALLERLVKDGRITQYQSDKFRAGKSADIYFGDYVVLEELGRGGMGTVLLARHRRMDREVAIKILPITTLESEAAVARFYQEVKVAAKLTHPNIVHAYDAGEHHGFQYLVMEYVKGHDLARVLQQLGPLPPALAIDYIAQAAAGLEYAHNKGVVHRDIKPSNLLLDDEGVIKILDMGLARIGSIHSRGQELSDHLTTTGQVMGTVEFMSPEQAEDTRSADCRSDIYSLGCTLYKLLTDQSPFSRETMVKTILAHREAPIPSLPAGKDSTFANLDTVFKKMVAKNPDQRYQTVVALREDLRLVERQLSESRDEITVAIPVGKGLVDSMVRPSPMRPSPKVPSPKVPLETPVTNTPPAVIAPTILSDNAGEVGPAGLLAANYSATPSSPSQPSKLVHVPKLISGPQSSAPSFVILKPHRGKRLLVMGAAAVLTASIILGAVLGVVVWVFAHSDLKEMEKGILDSSGQQLTHAAKILGIISVIIGGLMILGSAIKLALN